MENIAENSLKKLFCNNDTFGLEILITQEKAPNLHQLLITLRDQIQTATFDTCITFEVLEQLITDEQVSTLMCTDKISELICDKYHTLYSGSDQ